MKKAIIIGAGPAGLTAAYELLKRTDIIPIILEKSGDIGGISKTINYKGNRMDIGGHRFFSKSDRVMNWWLNILPLQPGTDSTFSIKYQNKSRDVDTSKFPSENNNPDKIMLVRKRLSRIYFLRKFFPYPISLSIETLRKLGLGRTIKIMYSYILARLFPRYPEKSLEDFMINRFGKKLYNLFFKDYTEKVWGVPCDQISAEWGAQRIKGVSITKAIQHAVNELSKKKKATDLAQKDTETSLIEQFLYPRLGPGQLWEEVAHQVQKMGGIIHMHHDVKTIHTYGDTITAITVVNKQSGEEVILEGDYFFSTMPVKELIAGIQGHVPQIVQNIAAGLQYRDFITVGILLKQLSSQDPKTGEWQPLKLEDTWIYIQEKEVTVGRLQLFNNWSPYMVSDPDTVWVGMEFFCNETDEFWKLPDEKIAELAINELEKIGLASSENVLDSTVLRVEKTYPAYFGTYEQFEEIKNFTNQFGNLFLVGRNGMHKYNNADHSMLTAMVAVDNIIDGITSKDNLWSINTEQEYHEEKNKDNHNNQPPSGEENSSKPQSLKNYVFRDPVNKTYIKTAIIAIIIQLLFFKYWYPFANYIHGDSFAYIGEAYENVDIDTYPIGYPKFIRLFSVFTRSDLALVVFQYLLLQASILSLIFSLFYFFSPGRITRMILFGFMLFNPVFLHLANLVSSDTLFLSLSLIWFNILLWSIYYPTPKLMVAHAFVFILAFMVRYNALFYPLVAGVAFLLYRNRLILKLGGLALCCVLVYTFIHFNQKKYYELCGKSQFTPFTGWQIANNAMYAYKFVPPDERKPVPARFQLLDNMIRNYFDTTRDLKKHPEEALVASTVYMWTRTAPLRKYMDTVYKKDTISPEFKKWAAIAPTLKDYGSFIIKQYPLAFLEFYIMPNSIKYYAPPIEFLETYNDGKEMVAPNAKQWFDYKTDKVTSIFKDPKVEILNYFPIVVGIMNVVFFMGLLGFLLLEGYKKYKIFSKSLLLVVCLWIFNFGFSVFASPIALRFQLFPILVMISFAILFIEILIKEAIQEKEGPDEIKISEEKI